MHLLAAKPGGFTDEEGIIDLQQSPAQVVILSAADSSLAALASTLESMPSDLPSVRLANWTHLLKPAAFDLYEAAVLEHAELVVLSLLGGKNYWEYGLERLQAWSQGRTQGKPRQLIVVPGDDAADQELFDASTVERADAVMVWRYIREAGKHNNVQLINFLAAQYFSQARRWQEPRSLPNCLIYMPADRGEYSQASLADWQQRWQQSVDSAPVAAVLFYRSHLQSGNTQMFDQLIDCMEQQGLRPLPIAINSLKDAESLSLVNDLLLKSGAKIILNSTGFASNTVSSPELSSQPTEFNSPFALDIPVLQLILASSRQQDWQDYSQGLSSRDIAMQVVLPEMDGRIISRAISFKSEAFYSDRCQISVLRYSLHRERAEFVVKLASNYCQLSGKKITTNGLH